MLTLGTFTGVWVRPVYPLTRYTLRSVSSRVSRTKLEMRGSMNGKSAITGKTMIVFIAIGLGVGILIGALFGWRYSILGLGAALGPWVGAYFGNKKAREVDKYRGELIRGRQRPPTSDDPTG